MGYQLLPFDQCSDALKVDDRSKKIGHIRADHDGRRWWTSYWPSAHSELMTLTRKKEINTVCDYLLTQKFPNGISEIVSLCRTHPTAAVGNPDDGEYNFGVVGVECSYWVRLITCSHDYNMYLHCFVKEGKEL